MRFLGNDVFNVQVYLQEHIQFTAFGWLQVEYISELRSNEKKICVVPVT